MCVCGAWPSNPRSGSLGTSASFALPGCGLKPGPAKLLTRPFSRMMRVILRLEATMPLFASSLFSRGAPYSRLPASKASITSPAMGSGSGSRSGWDSIQ